MEFGEYLRARRAKVLLGLREFCERVEMDPGNVSKIERGRLLPPEDEARLERMAIAVGIEPGSAEWREFRDMAAIARGKVPPDLLSDEEVAGKLPAFFRTLRGRPIDADHLAPLIEKIRRA